MALGATLYVFNIDLADADRGIYQPLELRIARHPSESAEYMLTRVLAYCCEYDEGIEFSNGLSEPDAPTIATSSPLSTRRLSPCRACTSTPSAE